MNLINLENYMYQDRSGNWQFKHHINPYIHIGYNYFNERCEEPNEPSYSAWEAGVKFGFELGQEATKRKLIQDAIQATC